MFVVLTVCLVLGHTGRFARSGSCVYGVREARLTGPEQQGPREDHVASQRPAHTHGNDERVRQMKRKKEPWANVAPSKRDRCRQDGDAPHVQEKGEADNITEPRRSHRAIAEGREHERRDSRDDIPV